VVTATIMGETVGGFPTPVALQGALHGGSVQTQIVHAAMLPGLTTAVSSTESATRSTCNHVGTVHETRTMVAGEAQVACEEIITVVQYDRFLNPIYTAPQATVTGCPTGTTCSQFFVRYSYDGVITKGTLH
jgi:acyl-coenzyme A thioesterase PaaI-like protein